VSEITRFNASFETEGWDRLEVHTNPDVDDDVAAKAAGYYEGAVCETASAFYLPPLATFFVEQSCSRELCQNAI
jgi:hypothetical protein